MKRILWLSSLFFSCSVFAALEPLENDVLQAVTGQGGADISLELRLNHDGNADFVCANDALEYCRIALAINNRNHDGTPTGSPTGRKQWLVFKGIQGTINIQEIKLDGTDLTYGSTVKPAIQLSYDPLKPILIRNFGYQSLAIETDTVANEGAGNVPGYLATGVYGGTGFDAGREFGFTGLNMHGNLSLAGTIKIFGCDGHPRC
ncbi:MAG: hypothetical protein VXW65_05960 [Pseudomonadota bacterium]|nr:hypothetical protein [Pseudomonadota bacterium]